MRVADRDETRKCRNGDTKESKRRKGCARKKCRGKKAASLRKKDKELRVGNKEGLFFLNLIFFLERVENHN